MICDFKPCPFCGSKSIGVKDKLIDSMEMKDAIVNGTVLPKGHGRLIDANILRSMYSINRANFNTVVGIQKWIDDAPTIIEADRSEEE